MTKQVISYTTDIYNSKSSVIPFYKERFRIICGSVIPAILVKLAALLTFQGQFCTYPNQAILSEMKRNSL